LAEGDSDKAGVRSSNLRRLIPSFAERSKGTQIKRTKIGKKKRSRIGLNKETKHIYQKRIRIGVKKEAELICYKQKRTKIGLLKKE